MGTRHGKTQEWHVATEWMGHSEEIAREHYLQVKDEDFERATEVEMARKVARAFTNIGDNRVTLATGQTALCGCKSLKVDEDMPNVTESEDSKVTGLGLEPRTRGLKGRCSTN